MFPIFPRESIVVAISQYASRKGQPPKVLVVSSSDYVGYVVTCTLPEPASLGLDMITFGDFLEEGEAVLAVSLQSDHAKDP